MNTVNSQQLVSPVISFFFQFQSHPIWQQPFKKLACTCGPIQTKNILSTVQYKNKNFTCLPSGAVGNQLYQLHFSVFMLLSFTFPFLCCTNQAWTCIICIEREQPDKHAFLNCVCAVDVNVFIQILS